MSSYSFSTQHIVPLNGLLGSTERCPDSPGGVRFRSTGSGICQDRWLVRAHQRNQSEGNK
jgi:hypothetical protein